VRAAITGVSGIVDARGRIRAETRANERTLVRGTVRLEEEITAWTRWGFRLTGVADAAAVAVLIFGLARRFRERRLAASGSGLSKP
jgi:apolipoprotein N-acyltransferase